MKPGPVVTEIIEAFSELGDPGRVEKSKTYFPTAMKVMGVSNPRIKAVIKAVREKYNDWSDRAWIDLCKALVVKDIFECQVLAFELIGRDRKLIDALSIADLNELARNLDNWASVDHFSVGIYGVLWGRGLVTDRRIDELLQSENHWDRRVAVVSTVALNLKSRGGKGDSPRTLRVCERVVDDRNEMIRKALSWALRELSKCDREAVVNFMSQHGARMAPRVAREVNHKLDFGTKN